MVALRDKLYTTRHTIHDTRIIENKLGSWVENQKQSIHHLIMKFRFFRAKLERKLSQAIRCNDLSKQVTNVGQKKTGYKKN